MIKICAKLPARFSKLFEESNIRLFEELGHHSQAKNKIRNSNKYLTHRSNCYWYNHDRPYSMRSSASDVIINMSLRFHETKFLRGTNKSPPERQYNNLPEVCKKKNWIECEPTQEPSSSILSFSLGWGFQNLLWWKINFLQGANSESITPYSICHSLKVLAHSTKHHQTQSNEFTIHFRVWNTNKLWTSIAS